MKAKSIIIGGLATLSIVGLGVWLYPIAADVLRPAREEVVRVSPAVQHLVESSQPVAAPSPAEVGQTPAETPKPSQPPTAPPPQPGAAPVVEQPVSSNQTIPSRYVIAGVPFLSQAPSANWDMPYQEACEEASVIMVNRYYTGKPLGSIEEQDALIIEIAAWGDDHLGAVDTNVATTARYFTEYIGLSADRVSVVYDMTISDIKAVLASGKPIIVPAAGRELGNPYFTAPGPLYHMLVIVGYDEDEFIAHDPGTRRGEAFRYKQQVLFNAIHDLPADKERVLEGRKAMIVVSPPAA